MSDQEHTPEVTTPKVEAVTPAQPVEITIPKVQKPVMPSAVKREPSTTVQQDFEIFEPVAEWRTDAIYLPLPGDNFARTQKAISVAPNVALDDTLEGKQWLANLENSTKTIQRADVFTETFAREGAAFRQAVPSERGPLTAAAPSFKDTENTKLTGERAVLRVKALLNMGSIVQIPLWHSGFWLSLKAPSEGEMLELYRRLGDEKVWLGRQTHGLAFANTSVFFVGAVMEFALSNFYDCSLKDNSLENVRSKISSLDIPLIAWGLACVTWPRGFQYARSVVDGDTTRVIKEKINVGKLLWTDTTALTAWQVAHMAQRGGNTMIDDAVTRYRTEFTRGQDRTVQLRDNLSMTLRVPTLDQYLVSGQKWINAIVLMIDRALGMTDNSDERNKHIVSQGQATNMRQFAHWVESIQVGSNTIEDIETIEMTLDALSSEEDIRQKYLTETRKYMEDATVSLVAVPAVTEEENSGLPRFPHLLPLDALSTFFTLLEQKTDQIQSRL